MAVMIWFVPQIYSGSSVPTLNIPYTLGKCSNFSVSRFLPALSLRKSSGVVVVVVNIWTLPSPLLSISFSYIYIYIYMSKCSLYTFLQ